ncbi:MAG: polyprenyl synthetase family protein, partial [Melioribacteraceae bacterium]|nr:polyprenyl synthetase family protein [Melioribacteraceae bacterium]
HNPVDTINTFNNSVIEVCEGQSLDKDYEIKKKVTIDEYKTMVYKKTASLIKMCCSIGAKIGGGSKKEVKALENYGKYLGMAFQLQDDLLDIMGTEKKFGKIVGGDLIEGKKTFLFLKALERGKGEDKKVLLKFIENNGIKKNQVKKYKLLYEKLDVINITKSEIKRYTMRAIGSLNNISNLKAKENLIWLANSLINRSQ